ncbi:RNA-directed DNA polymerase-like protein [Gossypium australe]|uniref:RNA-directed DNA polymerase-like protein n=1 Tax=Gossypium australe TaxID=47621 RepID=A0A5B6VBI0_9ROSI|nr:RNA-directed DNA polymerase-like protein [Gossypium australe]
MKKKRSYVCRTCGVRRGYPCRSEKHRGYPKWKQPKNISIIRSFLILAGYYCRIIKRFSLIFAPLSKWLRKNVPFKWTKDHQASFEKLKVVLTQALVLIQPESRK